MPVNSRNSVILVLHAVLVFFAILSAWALRFEFHLPNLQLLLMAAPILIVYRLASLARFGLLHGYWRYTGLHDGIDMSKALVLSSAAFFVSIRYILGIKAFPLSVYCLELLLAAFLLLGVRLLYRALMQSNPEAPGPDRRRSHRVLIVGAGFAAQLLIRELKQTNPAWIVVGCVDDEKSKVGSKVHGVPVLGTIEQLPELSVKTRTFEALIAMPSATAAQMQRVVQICYSASLQYRTVPGLADLIHGRVTVDQLREVNLEDLLGRAPVNFDLDSVRRRIAGRIVMVTGAAGSIGSELCRQLLRFAPAKLICVDQAETPLFYLQHANSASDVERIYCVADVTDSKRMRDLMQEHDVRVIFHAAAYKHVPLMEENLQEAVKNNVLGLLSLLETADQCGCEDFLLISSDKAVNPTSFMGCTKRIGELIVAARPSASMRCLSVRFGNVLGSQGSVIPLFQEQIKATRQITVTHPEITRYFMTISEAVSLVLQGFTIGAKGDILVLDMGAPVRILDMAKTLIRLSGIPQSDVKIVFGGLRAGEKLFEELFYDFEQQVSTSATKVFQTRGQRTVWSELRAQLQSLRTETATGIAVRIRSKVKEIVPQYEWALPDCSSLSVHLSVEEPLNFELYNNLSSASD
jgi:FlaA1/EpsC-like NDP-sugar epimerase